MLSASVSIEQARKSPDDPGSPDKGVQILDSINVSLRRRGERFHQGLPHPGSFSY